MKWKVRLREKFDVFNFKYKCVILLCLIETRLCVNLHDNIVEQIDTPDSPELCKEASTPQYVKVSFTSQVVSNGM